MSLFTTLRYLYHPHRSNNHRARVLHPETMAALSVLAVVFTAGLASLSMISPQFGEVLGFASSITPVQVIEQTNRQRELQGLEPLVLNQTLGQAAAAKGQDMFNEQYWAHTSPKGLTPWKFMADVDYTYSVAGENLARDFSDTSSMVSAWMQSPTHRANILNSRYQDIGIAVIDGTLQGYETTLVVQMFGAPRALAADTDNIPEAASTQQLSVEEILPETSNQLLVAVEPNTQAQPEVLSSILVPQGTLNLPPLLTPLQVTKAVFLGLIMMIVFTLIYDSVVIGNRSVMRLVGKNLGHVMLFLIVAFLLISFKGGILG